MFHIVSHIYLGKNWSPGLDKGDHLVTNGIYSRIRHPMYTGFLLWSIGQALMIQNLLAGLPGIVIMVAFLLLRIRHEEKIIIEQFGDEYRDYMKKTNRFLPYL